MALIHAALRQRVEVRQRPQIMVIGIQMPGGLAPGSFDLRLAQGWLDRGDQARRHLVLQLEDVRELAVECIRPDMPVRSRP